jgi:hypothetical protein
MLNLPDNFSVVSDAEFAALAALPSFLKEDDLLTRMVGDELYVVIKRSLYDHFQALEAEVLAQEVSDEGSAMFESLLQQPMSEIKPMIKAGGIPEGDKAAGDRLFVDPGAAS